jgi:hypothetical protein
MLNRPSLPPSLPPAATCGRKTQARNGHPIAGSWPSRLYETLSQRLAAVIQDASSLGEHGCGVEGGLVVGDLPWGHLIGQIGPCGPAQHPR